LRCDAVCWTLTDNHEKAEVLSRTQAAARSSVDARAAHPPDVGKQPHPSWSRRKRSLSLLWWVFLANAAVLAIALLLLTFSPITIDAPIKTGQFALLLAGFVVLLGLNVILLRRVLAPRFSSPR
jgi:hypothetical protein